MKTSIFDFDLPKELIAQKPVSPRDSARLLHVGNDVTDLLVRDLTSLLTPGDVLVINDTKVIPARLRGKRDDVSIEITLHKKNKDETWCAFARPARRLHEGQKINLIKKSQKWWAQCFLVGVENLLVGYREKNGFVNEISEVTASLLVKSAVGYWSWRRSLSCLEASLNLIRETVLKEDVLYLFMICPESKCLKFFETEEKITDLYF